MPGVYRPPGCGNGDSFYGTLMDAGIPHRFFDPNSLFLYYFNEITNAGRANLPAERSRKATPGNGKPGPDPYLHHQKPILATAAEE